MVVNETSCDGVMIFISGCCAMLAIKMLVLLAYLQLTLLGWLRRKKM